MLAVSGSETAEHDDEPNQGADHAKCGGCGSHVAQDIDLPHGAIIGRLDSIGQKVTDLLVRYRRIPTGCHSEADRRCPWT